MESNRLKKIWEWIKSIWKNPVWSAVIATGITAIIAIIWQRYSAYTLKQIYDLLLHLLAYKIPVFVFLSLIAIFYIIKLISRLFKRKMPSIWESEVGNFKFGELHEILSSQSFPVQTAGMEMSLMKAPQEDLLTLFLNYSIFLNKGVSIDSNIGDGGYLYGALAPKLMSYGLVDKIETPNPKFNDVDVTYKISEDGRKLFALMEKAKYKSVKKQ
jgi:hypothetical protein